MAFVLLGAVLAGTGTAVAATGGNFILGRSNSAGATTSLKNTGTGATLTLPANVAGQPPLALSSSAGRVRYLNSDKIDGLDSTAFLRSTGKAADANKLDGFDSTAFARVAGTVGSIETVGVRSEVNPDVLEAYAACPAFTKITGGGHEVYTSSGAVISRAVGNGWYVATIADVESTGEDIVAVAQCYDPTGAVTGAIQSYSQPSDAPTLSDEDKTRLAKLAAKR